MNKEEELTAFTEIKNELLALLDPLDEDRMNRAPFPGSWTAGQLGEHLLKSYGVAEIFKGRTAPTPRPADGKYPQIDAVFLDFAMKFQSEDFIAPSPEKISGRDLKVGLRNATDGIAAFARDHDLTFTCLDLELPGFGALTAQEWLHLMSTHSRRHVRQLRNIISFL